MKNIYEILNDIDIDYENIDSLDTTELEERKLMKNLKVRIKKKASRKKTIVAAAISGLIITTALGVSFPTYAKEIPIIGDIFKVFENPIYNNYKENANELNITKESNDVKFTVNEAIFDGTTLNLTYTIESEKNLGESISLNNKITFKDISNNDYAGTSNFIKVSDTTYVGKESITIYDYVGNPNDILDFNLKVGSIIDLDTRNEIKGKWNFAINLNAVKFNTLEINKSTTKNGITFTIDKLTINPMSAVINYSQTLSEEISNKYDEVAIDIEVKDDLGNIYTTEGHFATGNENTLSSSATIEKLNLDAKKLIITPVITTKIYDDGNSIPQETKDNTTGKIETQFGETYNCIERKTLKLNSITIDLK